MRPKCPEYIHLLLNNIMYVTSVRWQWCWWQPYNGDFMMVTDRYVGDFFNVLNRSPTSWIGHQHLKLITNTFCLRHSSPTSKSPVKDRNPWRLYRYWWLTSVVKKSWWQFPDFDDKYGRVRQNHSLDITRFCHEIQKSSPILRRQHQWCYITMSLTSPWVTRGDDGESLTIDDRNKLSKVNICVEFCSIMKLRFRFRSLLFNLLLF